MKMLMRNFLALAVSIVSFAVAVGLVVGLEHVADFDLFSFMWWGFIPVGAFAIGCLAASGYYFGAVKLNVKPTQFTGAALFVLVALVQVALYYTKYAMTKTADGQAMRANPDAGDAGSKRRRSARYRPPEFVYFRRVDGAADHPEITT